MPSYDYRCEKCGHDFTKDESMQQHERRKQLKCPKCGSQKTRRVLQSAFVVTSKKS